MLLCKSNINLKYKNKKQQIYPVIEKQKKKSSRSCVLIESFVPFFSYCVLMASGIRIQFKQMIINY